MTKRRGYSKFGNKLGRPKWSKNSRSVEGLTSGEAGTEPKETLTNVPDSPLGE